MRMRIRMRIQVTKMMRILGLHEGLPSYRRSPQLKTQFKTGSKSEALTRNKQFCLTHVVFGSAQVTLIRVRKDPYPVLAPWNESTALLSSVADPDPNPDPHVFGPPGSGSGSISQSHGSGSGSFYHQAKKSKKNLDSYCFVTSFWRFIFENNVRTCTFKK